MPGRPFSLPRTLGAGLLGAAAALLPALAPQRAEALLLFEFRQVGSNIEVTSSGTYSTDGLILQTIGEEPDFVDFPNAELLSTDGPYYLLVGPTASTSGRGYVWTGTLTAEQEVTFSPLNLISGFTTTPFNQQAVIGFDGENDELLLPTSEACPIESICPIASATTVFSGISFANLGVAEGESFLWSWGGNENQKIRIDFLSSNDSVPGPLPALGGAAAFGWSRRLRRRVNTRTRTSSVQR